MLKLVIDSWDCRSQVSHVSRNWLEHSVQLFCHKNFKVRVTPYLFFPRKKCFLHKEANHITCDKLMLHWRHCPIIFAINCPSPSFHCTRTTPSLFPYGMVYAFTLFLHKNYGRDIYAECAAVVCCQRCIYLMICCQML